MEAAIEPSKLDATALDVMAGHSTSSLAGLSVRHRTVQLRFLHVLAAAGGISITSQVSFNNEEAGVSNNVCLIGAATP